MSALHHCVRTAPSIDVQLSLIARQLPPILQRVQAIHHSSAAGQQAAAAAPSLALRRAPHRRIAELRLRGGQMADSPAGPARRRRMAHAIPHGSMRSSVAGAGMAAARRTLAAVLGGQRTREVCALPSARGQRSCCCCCTAAQLTLRTSAR
jgi:hypothetical protein